jgi:hypothetical protein
MPTAVARARTCFSSATRSPIQSLRFSSSLRKPLPQYRHSLPRTAHELASELFTRRACRQDRLSDVTGSFYEPERIFTGESHDDADDGAVTAAAEKTAEAAAVATRACLGLNDMVVLVAAAAEVAAAAADVDDALLSFAQPPSAMIGAAPCALFSSGRSP